MPTICYIPLDDRPVNMKRCEYLAQAAGFNLLMPDANLCKTHLDNQVINQNILDDNQKKLINWFERIDADYYLISLDQILSGGLVNSRAVKDINAFDPLNTIDWLLEKTKNKKVILFDTIMRLASTVGYNGYMLDEYNGLRSYGSIPRVELDGDYSLDDIFKGYKYSITNELITSTLSQTIIDDYLGARIRKMKISDYLLNCLKNSDNVYLYYGVDDSTPSKTIQTNEINYIEKRIKNGILFSGTDEIGLMGMTKIIKEHYHTDINVKVTYFGGQEDTAADAYDISTLRANVINHIESLDANIVDSNFDIETLILTKPERKELTTKNVNQLISALKVNLTKQIPTIVIDCSTTTYYGPLGEALIKELPLGKLLGYSNWNTVANALGIALCNGMSRYCYLTSRNFISDEARLKADEGFLKSLTFSYIKDIGYKISGQPAVISYINQHIGDNSNFYQDNLDLEDISNNVYRILLDEKNGSLVPAILENLNKSPYITSYLSYQEKQVNCITIKDFYFPWYRTFEIDFETIVQI